MEKRLFCEENQTSLPTHPPGWPLITSTTSSFNWMICSSPRSPELRPWIIPLYTNYLTLSSCSRKNYVSLQDLHSSLTLPGFRRSLDFVSLLSPKPTWSHLESEGSSYRDVLVSTRRSRSSPKDFEGLVEDKLSILLLLDFLLWMGNHTSIHLSLNKGLMY